MTMGSFRRSDLIKLAKKAQRDPAWFIQRILRSPLWDKQVEIAEAVRDYPRVAVQSCHGAGKSYLAARIALWFLYAFPGSIVVTTAPTFRQVKKVLWKEMRVAWFRSAVPLGGKCLTTEIEVDSKGEEKWYAFGFSTKDPDAMQGIHAPHVLVIFDEAAGIPQPIWEPLEGILTSAHCRFLAIGNPTDPVCEFAKECRSEGTKTFRISAFDTPNLTSEDGAVVIPGLVTREWVEDKRKKWGERSPMWKARVLGVFPELSDKALIPLGWIEAARHRAEDYVKTGRIILGVDVARLGSDSTVIAANQNLHLSIVDKATKEKVPATVARVRIARDRLDADHINVDDIGVGGGVTDMLEEMKEPVTGVNVGRAPETEDDKEKFLNQRAVYYWQLRKHFEDGDAVLECDDDTAAQLASITFEIVGSKIRITDKEKIRKELGCSPDDADAIMLSIVPPESQQPGIMMW